MWGVGSWTLRFQSNPNHSLQLQNVICVQHRVDPEANIKKYQQFVRETGRLQRWLFLSFFLFSFKEFVYFLERGEERVKERVKNIDVHKKHWLVASCTPLTWNLACNPGMCPDQELSQWPFWLKASTQSTEPQWPGLASFLVKMYKSHFDINSNH